MGWRRGISGVLFVACGGRPRKARRSRAFTDWPKPEGVCQALEKIFCLVSKPEVQNPLQNCPKKCSSDRPFGQGHPKRNVKKPFQGKPSRPNQYLKREQIE